MATGQGGEISGEMFHDIETECDDAVQGKLALQIHITQPGNRPLPVGVITERLLMALVKRVTNYTPIAMMIMNDSCKFQSHFLPNYWAFFSYRFCLIRN